MPLLLPESSSRTLRACSHASILFSMPLLLNASPFPVSIGSLPPSLGSSWPVSFLLSMSSPAYISSSLLSVSLCSSSSCRSRWSHPPYFAHGCKLDHQQNELDTSYGGRREARRHHEINCHYCTDDDDVKLFNSRRTCR